MRALVFDHPATTPSIRDVAAPQPDDDQLLIAVRYAGCNFADALGTRGEHGYASGWPFIPGLEVGGEIAAVGPGISGFEPGQTVVALTPHFGGYAEQVTADPKLTAVVPSPVPLATATAVPLTVSTVILLLRYSGLNLDVASVDQPILVHSAAGALGQLIAQFINSAGVGARLIGTVGRPESVDAARAAGYSEVILREPGWADRVLELSGGVDVAFDPIGGSSIHETLRTLAIGGRLMSLGNAGGEPDVKISVGDLRTRGVYIGGHSTISLGRTQPEIVEGAMRAGFDQLVAGGMDLLVTTMPLTAAAEVLATAVEHLSTGKIIFDVTA